MGIRVLFIGSNPSQKSSKTAPFWHDTKSRKVLDKWLLDAKIDAEYIDFLNVCMLPTPGNRPLKITEIRGCLRRLEIDIVKFVRPDYIITLGKTAEKALILLHLLQVCIYSLYKKKRLGLT